MPKPNLLFIFTDEQRYDTMAAYGNQRIHTPHLDALARQSVVFSHAYVTQPVCTPSRSSIMTGLYPHTSGCTANNIPLPEDVPTLAEMCQDGDYRFAYHGKWHLGDEIFPQHRFTDWISIEDGYRRYYRPHQDQSAHCSYYHWLLSQGFTPEGGEPDFPVFPRGQAAGLPAQYSKPEFLARTASRFIREHRDDPFVLYINYLEPHMPFTGPYNDMYRPEEIALPANFDTPPHPDEPLKCQLLRERYAAKGFGDRDLSTEAGWRRLIANYWGLVSLVDESVGRILAALSECGLDDRTLVVYTSDHGDMMGSHRLLAKTVMYQEAVRVPLLMRVPGLSAARVDAPVGQIDLVPTLLDLMGQPVPDALPGRSLRPVLEGRGGPAEDHVFIEWNGRDGEEQYRSDVQDRSEAERIAGSASRCAISPDGWKLNLSVADKSELYNLNADPLETTNLFYSGRHTDIIRRLTDQIRRWQEATGDGVALPMSF